MSTFKIITLNFVYIVYHDEDNEKNFENQYRSHHHSLSRKTTEKHLKEIVYQTKFRVQECKKGVNILQRSF